jgi:Tol biopolymer transport system component
MGQLPDQPSRIYIIDSSGGQPGAVKPRDLLEQGVPTFSGDGRYLAYGELRQSQSDDDEMMIRLFDLKTNKETILPASQDKWTPRWSPDGRYIVALATDFGSLSLFDCSTRHWKELVTARLIDDPVWSLDSSFVHYSRYTAQGVRSLFRVRIADAVVERLAPFPPWQIAWSGVSPDGSPLVPSSKRIDDIYAIDFK